MRIRNIVGPASPRTCASRCSRTTLPAWVTRDRTGAVPRDDPFPDRRLPAATVEDYRALEALGRHSTPVSRQRSRTSPAELSTANTVGTGERQPLRHERRQSVQWAPVGRSPCSIPSPTDGHRSTSASRTSLRDGWPSLSSLKPLDLPPGGEETVFFMALPSGRPENPQAIPGRWTNVPASSGSRRSRPTCPYADTFIPIGGVDLWTHLVNRTRIECEARQAVAAPISILSGRLIPAIANARIAIETLAGGRTGVQHVTTNAEGTFVVSAALGHDEGLGLLQRRPDPRRGGDGPCNPAWPCRPGPSSTPICPLRRPCMIPIPPSPGLSREGRPKAVWSTCAWDSRNSRAPSIFTLLSSRLLSADLIWMIREDLGPPAGSSPVAEVRSNTTGPIDEHLYATFPLHYFPKGNYFLLTVVTPAGSLSGYYLWATGFVAP
ncbi:MAG: hypothetical protein MZV70_00775 [Desulfobacterales bacterium]|nr:hypothetical protein [Desulfobacterales bacterium]